jgi:hypothetical protein
MERQLRQWPARGRIPAFAVAPFGQEVPRQLAVRPAELAVAPGDCFTKAVVVEAGQPFALLADRSQVEVQCQAQL